MNSQAQIRYLEEVLGASPRYFYQQPVAEETHALTVSLSVAVLTASLQPSEQVLLKKILASVHLEITPTVCETPVGQLPAEIGSPTHVLTFAGGAVNREVHGQTVWWCLPSLSQMADGQVTAAQHKKAAWSLLQAFAKEWRA